MKTKQIKMDSELAGAMKNLPFALFDVNDHAPRIDVARLQMHSLGNAQAGRVTRRQNRAGFDMRHALQELEDFLLTKNHR
jgi:hypothetical protein